MFKHLKNGSITEKGLKKCMLVTEKNDVCKVG